MKNNVEQLTVKKNLCTSCGICKAVCPKDCIEFKRFYGQYVPHIISNKCIDCGTCLDICPGYQVKIEKFYMDANMPMPDDIYIGHYDDCYNSYARDGGVQKNSASGGCITSIVNKLLEEELYNRAFLVGGYSYDDYIGTCSYQKGDSLKDTMGSRYIPISHYEMIKHVLINRNDKIIIIGTSCVIHGFLNVVSKFKLKRDNYLILGLFCERIFNYNVYNYFSKYGNPNSKLEKLHFKTKENYCWPGRVKLEYLNGECRYLPASERVILKDFFQLERCLYCIDKLNQFADISLGDNYTGKNNHEMGSNSIIVRTKKGSVIWDYVNDLFVNSKASINDICRSQYIYAKIENLQFASVLKDKSKIDLYPDLPLQKVNSNIHAVLINKLNAIELGRDFDKRKFKLLSKIKLIKIKNLVHVFLSRCKQNIIKRFKKS